MAPPALRKPVSSRLLNGKRVRPLYALWAMGRPLFLLGAVPLYLLGVALAWRDTTTLHLTAMLTGLVLAWLVQLTTHYANEYYDLKTDRATRSPTRISGGSRVLVRGLVPPQFALKAAWAGLMLATLLGLAMTFSLGTGSLTPALVSLALFLGWFYSAPPLRLHSRGLGELCIVLESCFLLPATAYYFQTGRLSLTIPLMALPLALLTFALTLATELPDEGADRATDKLTLVSRLGAERAARLQSVSFILGWLSWGAVAWSLVPPWALLLIAASAVPAVTELSQRRRAVRGDIAAMERMGLANSLLLGYATTVLSGLVLLG